MAPGLWPAVDWTFPDKTRNDEWTKRFDEEARRENPLGWGVFEHGGTRTIQREDIVFGSEEGALSDADLVEVAVRDIHLAGEILAHLLRKHRDAREVDRLAPGLRLGLVSSSLRVTWNGAVVRPTGVLHYREEDAALEQNMLWCAALYGRYRVSPVVRTLKRAGNAHVAGAVLVEAEAPAVSPPLIWRYETAWPEEDLSRSERVMAGDHRHLPVKTLVAAGLLPPAESERALVALPAVVTHIEENDGT